MKTAAVLQGSDSQADPKEIISSLFNLNSVAKIRWFHVDFGDAAIGLNAAKLNLNSFNFNLNTFNEPIPLNCLYLNESVHATAGGSRVCRKLKVYLDWENNPFANCLSLPSLFQN